MQAKLVWWEVWSDVGETSSNAFPHQRGTRSGEDVKGRFYRPNLLERTTLTTGSYVKAEGFLISNIGVAVQSSPGGRRFKKSHLAWKCGHAT